MSIHRIIALITKELQEQFSTARGIFAVAMPMLLQTLLFPFVVTMDVTHLTVALLNEDGGAASMELCQRIAAAPYVRETGRVNGEDGLQQAIASQHALAGVHIPADFSRRLDRGEAAPIQIVADGRRSNSAQIAAGYLESIAAGLGDTSMAAAQPVTRHLYNPTLEYRWFILPCIFGLLGLITSLNISCMSLAKEREEGTYEQLCITPMSPMETLIGKTVPATLVVLVQAAFVWFMACCVYRIPFQGSPVALFAAVLLYSLSLTGVGFAISSLCRTQQQAFVGMFCYVVPAILLSGFVSPVENMPDALQSLARLDPLYYIFIATRGIFLKGYSLADILPCLKAFTAIGAFTITLAYTFLKIRKA